MCIPQVGSSVHATYTYSNVPHLLICSSEPSESSSAEPYPYPNARTSSFRSETETFEMGGAAADEPLLISVMLSRHTRQNTRVDMCNGLLPSHPLRPYRKIGPCQGSIADRCCLFPTLLIHVVILRMILPLWQRAPLCSIVRPHFYPSPFNAFVLVQVQSSNDLAIHFSVLCHLLTDSIYLFLPLAQLDVVPIFRTRFDLRFVSGTEDRRNIGFYSVLVATLPTFPRPPAGSARTPAASGAVHRYLKYRTICQVNTISWTVATSNVAKFDTVFQFRPAGTMHNRKDFRPGEKYAG